MAIGRTKGDRCCVIREVGSEITGGAIGAEDFLLLYFEFLFMIAFMSPGVLRTHTIRVCWLGNENSGLASCAGIVEATGS